MMKVLHVISDQNIGGAGVLLCNLLTSFQKEKVESIVALPRNAALAPRVLKMGIPVRYLSKRCDRTSPAAICEMLRLIRKERPDIVHANAALSARIAAKLCGVPVVHTRHCCFPHTGMMRYRWVRRIAGLCNRMLSDHVIATAEAAAENLRELGIPEHKMSVIINGSLPVRTPSEEEIAATRAKYGLTKDDFVIGICARLEECKGQDTFLEAAAILRQRRPQVPFRFLIVGEGSRHEELDKMVSTFALNDCVTFTGFVSDMAPIYHVLRVNVNCSSGTETSCLAISEGMSAGLPTVASDYGGNVAMIGEEGAGFLFPVGDAFALARVILRIVDDPALEECMRRHARERYLSHFTAEKMAQEVTQVYEKLL